MSGPAVTIVPLGDANASLALVGGKALSLSKMVAAGFPIPAGFILSTKAYQEFVEANKLEARIYRIVADLAEKNP